MDVHNAGIRSFVDVEADRDHRHRLVAQFSVFGGKMHVLSRSVDSVVISDNQVVSGFHRLMHMMRV